ncbi:MAG: GAF domain-containing protein [Anaerolineales bacterium]|nr:GAF domain-containing protein [Anaerolineales bacterium]
MVDPQLFRTLKEENIDLKLENSDLKNQNSKLWRVIRTLNELQVNLQVFTSSPDLLEMVMNILSIALEAVESENGSILLLDEDDDELVFIAVVGDRVAELTDFRIPADSGIAGWVKTHKKAALVPDVRNDNRWISAVDQSIGFHTQSLMAVPLILEDRVLGVMEIVNSLSEDHFHEKDLALLQLVARLASFVFGRTEEILNKSEDPKPETSSNK